MSTYFSTRQVEGLVIQEIDENKNVIFQWRSFDHFDIIDYGVDTSLKQTIFIHGNAIEVDFDDHILVSLRAMDQIVKVDRIVTLKLENKVANLGKLNAN